MILTKKFLVGLIIVIFIAVAGYYSYEYYFYFPYAEGNFVMPYTVKVEAIGSPYSITKNDRGTGISIANATRKAYSDFKPSIGIFFSHKLGFIDQNSLKTVIYNPDIIYSRVDNKDGGHSIKIENIPLIVGSSSHTRPASAKQAVVYLPDHEKGKIEENVKINYFIPNDPSINKKFSKSDYDGEIRLDNYPDPVVLNFENGVFNIRDKKTNKLVYTIEGEVATVEYKITIDIPTNPWKGHFEEIHI